MALVSFLLNELIHSLFVAPKKTWTMNRLMSPCSWCAKGFIVCVFVPLMVFVALPQDTGVCVCVCVCVCVWVCGWVWVWVCVCVWKREGKRVQSSKEDGGRESRVW